MLGHLTKYIIPLFIFAFSFSGHAQTAAIDSLKIKLVETDNLPDSITILYNIYDISPSSLQGRALEDLYEVAMRGSDYHTVSDVLKHSSKYYAENDSMQQVLMSRAEKLPDSEEKQSTLVYINVMSASNLIRSLTKTQREANLRDYLARHAKSETFEKYERIEYLFKLCKYLSISTEGEMLTNYLQELQPLIDSIPTNDFALKSLFYIQAANNYLLHNMIPEAVVANKTLLSIIEGLEKKYSVEGRTFRNYEKSAFKCYLNLLRCHEALPQEEVDIYYNKITSLIDNNPSLQDLSGQLRKATIYYKMAKKHYADAIPLIKEQLNDCVNSSDEQLYMVDALLQAADKTGDKEDMLMALEMSNDILKKRIENKAAESYKDLQIIYEVNDLKQTNDKLMLTNQQILINRHKEQLTYAIISVAVLVILLVIVFILYRRSKQLTSNLKKSNSMITNERDALQNLQKDLIDANDKAKEANRIKTDFVNHISHEIRNPLEAIVEYSTLISDCADSKKRDNLKRFADVITLNTDLLLTLVNDVLDLPSLENAKVSVHITKSSVQQICDVVIDNVRRHIRPGIELKFVNEGETDTTIMTDPDRVEQVLLNLLMNAAKFTEKGSISLEYAISSKCDQLTFTITDTGIGIPDSKKNTIFSRLEKLDSITHGKGLGLYISRLLANMLGGSLILDEDYRNGAKFIFSIPIS